MPAIFTPANGQLDLNRLRLQADGIPISPAFLATVIAGIQAWAPVLGIPIVNLNPIRPPAPSDFPVYIGDGTGTMAQEPQNTLLISYVASDHAYFFDTATAPVISHEFGHMLGLADRYYEGYQHAPLVAGIRTSVPMDGTVFPNEPDYIPGTNLMSGAGAGWTVTAAQIQAIMSGTEESRQSRRVVFLVDTTGSLGSAWSAQPTLYLSGDNLWAPDPPPPDLPIAGYRVIGGLVFFAKAGPTGLGNGPVRALWNLRASVDGNGQPATRLSWFRYGKKYRSRRLLPAGPRIHRPMMKMLGELAGL